MLEVEQVGFTDGIFIDNNLFLGNPVVVWQTGDFDGDGDTDRIAGLDTNPTVGVLDLGGGVVVNMSVSVQGSFHQSNSPGTPLLAFLSSASTDVKNVTGTDGNLPAQTIMQTILVGDTGFLNPNPSNMHSTSSGTIINGNIHVATYDDPLNRQFGGTIDFPDGGAVNGLNATFTNLGNNAGASIAANPPDVPFNDISPPLGYAKAIQFDLTLGAADATHVAGELIGRSILIQNTAVVPEPGTLALVITGLGTLGLGTWRRRRRARA